MYKNLNSYQVLQRSSNDKALVELANGEIIELAVGGPYTIGEAHDILVGDIWVLAGQSNMEGVGDLLEIEKPSPFVHSFQSREQWAIAEEPLHWLLESPHSIHQQLILGPESRPGEVQPRDPNRSKGAGLGISFGKERYVRTGVPVGLIPAAHGGTSMAQWSPQKRDEGGASLYGALLARVKRVGGRIAGVLWYQGESDANPDDAVSYQRNMSELVQGLREDIGQFDLPFYYVQIGRVVKENVEEPAWDPKGWHLLREAQRTWLGRLPQIAMVSAIDLELDDLIHIGTNGLKRLGRRLADAADGQAAPSLQAITFEEEGRRIRIAFQHVRGGLRSHGRPTGFSLRTSQGIELLIIYKQTLEENCVLLHLTTAVPSNTELWYGWGIDPYCNITDGADAAIPAFGPLLLA